MSQTEQIESFAQPTSADNSSSDKFALEAYQPGTNDSTVLSVANVRKSATELFDKVFGDIEIFDGDKKFQPKNQSAPTVDANSQILKDAGAAGNPAGNTAGPEVNTQSKPETVARPEATPPKPESTPPKPETGATPADATPPSPAGDTTLAKAPEKPEVVLKDSDKIDRSKLENVAEHLRGEGGLGFGDWGRESKREELAWSGELQDRLKSLTPDERAALKGIYKEKYGTTLDADYAFLKGDQKKEFESILQKDDPASKRADHIMTLMGRTKDDYKSLSYTHVDRDNANRELRDTLKGMTAKEIEETDKYFQLVYGKTLQQSLNEGTPKTTKEMCNIYLKGSDNLTPADTQKLNELTNEEKARVEGTPNPNLTAKDTEALFNKNFERLDWNEDGVISTDEIDRAMSDSDYKGEDAQLVVLLKEKREKLAVLSSDSSVLFEKSSITKQDMAKLTELANKPQADRTAEENDLIEAVDNRLYKTGNAIKDSNKKLYGTPDPIDSITPEAIDQEQVGDCYFLASVAAVAKTKEGKESLKNMIEDNKDGTYTVRFPGNPRAITVDEPTDAELAHGAAAGKEGVWVAVLEKAYAKYQAKETGEKPRYMTDGIEGGYTNEALELLTNKRVKDVSLYDTSKDEMHKILTKSMEDDRPVTCEIDDPDDEETESKKEDNPAGLPTGHSYTVTGYDPATKMVTVRNPWGSGEPKDKDGKTLDGNNDGTFTMSLDDFYRNFHSVQYARAESDKDKEKSPWWNPFS